jgi:hypothetical protein
MNLIMNDTGEEVLRKLVDIQVYRIGLANTVFCSPYQLRMFSIFLAHWKNF